jgi:hypothetical protein
MPKKYHIEGRLAPHRQPVIGRSGIIDWGEGCLKCPVCVKKECVYGAYEKRSFSTAILGDTIDELCKSCFRCVQGCPGRLIHKTLNPEWQALGDEVYAPELITSTWEQARTGKIPVSGAGYGGRFSGKGFDSMWTDMSEIVRPTRDGIHGREYISTAVEIGRRPSALRFDASGKLLTGLSPLVKLPAPIIFDPFPFGALSPALMKGVATAAKTLGLMMVVSRNEARALDDFKDILIPLIEPEDHDVSWAADADMVEVSLSSDYADAVSAIRRLNPRVIAVLRAPATAESIEVAREAFHRTMDCFHLVATEKGEAPGNPRVHLKDIIRLFHGRFLDEGVRDETTFIASGGVAAAEHVMKAVLCGANLVAVDIPLLIALECRVCRNCVEGGDCPARLPEVDAQWAAQRIVNLMAAWHNQLLELMGAMGVREIRRLRGERGRLMFYEDLEAETFGRLFGDRR